MGRRALNRTLVLTGMFVLAFTVAALALPAAYAQSTGKPASMFAVGIPLIVGLGVGVVYWAIITARRSGR